MIIDLHVCNYFPYSNINRGEDTLPKTATMPSGRVRAVWSSQSQKAQLRRGLRARLGNDNLSTRTRTLPADLLAEVMGRGQGPGTESLVAAKIATLITAMKLKLDLARPAKGAEEDEVSTVDVPAFGGLRGTTTVQLQYTRDGLTKLADLLLQKWELIESSTIAGKTPKFGKVDKGVDTAALEILRNAEAAVDTALFGRFLAEIDARTVAAVSVAHSLSTHDVELDSTLFVGKDDRDPIGSGSMGTQAFVTAAFYRYESIDVDELMRGPIGDKPDLILAAIEEVVRSFATLQPYGLVHSTAAMQLPFMVVATVTENRANPLGTAFAAGVDPEDVVADTVTKAAELHRANTTFFGLNPVGAYFHTGPADVEFEGLSRAHGLEDIVAAVRAAVRSKVIGDRQPALTGASEA